MRLELELKSMATPLRLASLCNMRGELYEKALCPCFAFECPFEDKPCIEIIEENWEDLFDRQVSNHEQNQN